MHTNLDLQSVNNYRYTIPSHKTTGKCSRIKDVQGVQASTWGVALRGLGGVNVPTLFALSNVPVLAMI